MAFQPSPMQMQTPTFASPLDQLTSEITAQAGPSGGRGAILERAFSLTRGSKVASRRHDDVGDGQTPSTRRDGNRQPSPSRENIQRLREARLSQQQEMLMGHSSQTAHYGSTGGATQAGPSQQSTVSNAFRDSIASDISFNTITGTQERSSMMLDGLMRVPPRPDSIAPENSIDDQIAREVRGLALRRRPSMDTVRSSEFGDEGRWAKAWAGSDDEDEEDEMDLQAMRAHNLSSFDLEAPRHQRQTAGFGALGDLGNLNGARAAMHENKGHRIQVPHAAAQLPAIKTVPGAEHFVSVTSAKHRAGATVAQASDYRNELLPKQRPPQRRDTIVSIAGEVGEVSSKPESSTYGGPASAASSPESSFVKVWPPTPAGSERRDSYGTISGRQSKRDTLLANPRSIVGTEQSVSIQGMPDGRAKPLPLSPSVALTQEFKPEPSPLETSHTPVRGAGYGDPNQNTELTLDGLGKARRKAIAQHGGRESLVSDLDVETLRLDGASTIAGEVANLASRRGSSSTIGTVTSEALDEMRKRRSQMEHDDAAAAGLADYRRDPLAIRDGQAASTGHERYPARAPLSRGVPRRSNTLPEEEQQGIGAHLSPAPWAMQNAKPSRNSTGSDGRSLIPPLQVRSPQSQHSALTVTSPTRSGSAALAVVQSQAEKFLTLGISHHESGDLSRSAYYFERSAKVDGGCVVGMCMWGMALREGWGVRKDQKRGFEWISRAASRAGEIMSGSKGSPAQQHKTEAELKAIRSELKLSVYELGKCFCYGWGVKMDKQMALEYFELAAKLGDSDAQAEAGALLAAGKGCKKDLKRAAMYYRMAEAQGYDTVGLSWIHKDKYDPDQTPMASATTRRGR